MTQCDCFADKYIEYDAVVLVIDLLLLKPQAYRHVLYNILSGDSSSDSDAEGTMKWWQKKIKRFARIGKGSLSWGVVKLCTILILFEVYIKWSKIESISGSIFGAETVSLFLMQYLLLFSLSALEFSLYQAIVRGACLLILPQEKNAKAK